MKFLLVVAFFIPACAAAQTAPSPAKMGITADAAPEVLSVQDSTRTWVALGNVDPASHSFTPLGLLPIVTTGNLVKGTTAAMTGTASTQVIALVASKSIYVTSMRCKSSDPTNAVDTAVQIRDGSAGAVLDTLLVVHQSGEVDPGGSAPLYWTSSGNALYAQNVTTGASVICSASGYSG